MPLDVHRLVSMGRVSSFDVSPDRSWLAVEVGRADDEAARYRSELWRVPLDGGAPTRIGEGAFHDGAPRFRPDGVLLFTSDRTESAHKADDKADSDTFRQVWARLADGSLERLTDEPLGVSDFRVATSGRLVLLTRALPGVPHHNQRPTAVDRKKHGPSLLRYRTMPVRFWDHWLGDARPTFVLLDPDGRRLPLTPSADREYESHVDWDLSADGGTLVATRRWIGVDRVPLSALEIFDLDGGQSRVLYEEAGMACYGPILSPSGTRVLLGRAAITDKGIGRHILHQLELSTDTGRDVAAHWDCWPTPARWLDEQTVLATADERGSVPVFAIDLQADTVRPVSTDPASYGGLEVSGDRIFALRHALLDPPEVVSLPASGGAPSWHTALAGVDRAELHELAEVQTHEVAATDGATVPLFVVRPKQGTGAHPGLLWIHGGPRGQWGQTWHWRWNSLVAVSAGYVVGLPNPRGSTGLGQAFADGVWGNTWGAQCYEDVLAAADVFEARDDVDPSRVCAMGGSFGGYMTNWIGTQTDRFGCLITHASLYSFHQFAWTTDLPAWWQLEFGTDPWKDRDAYARYSPDMHLPNWKSPTLVIHGEKDYRVPIGEGLALFEGLCQHGVDAELAVFPDENHWILKPRNVVAWYDLVLEFLGRHLGAP